MISDGYPPAGGPQLIISSLGPGDDEQIGIGTGIFVHILELAPMLGNGPDGYPLKTMLAFCLCDKPHRRLSTRKSKGLCYRHFGKYEVLAYNIETKWRP